MTSTTEQTTTLKHGEKVRFNIVTRDGRDYLWTFQLFELYEHLLDEVAQGGYLHEQWKNSGLFLTDFVTKLYAEEVERFGADAAISLRPETAVLAVYSDEQKAAMKAEREAIPVLKTGDVIEVRGDLYEIAKVTRDAATLKRLA